MTYKSTKRLLAAVLFFLSILFVPANVLAQGEVYNIYEIGKGEILKTKYRYIEYLYDDLLAAIPYMPGVEDYDWSNLTGVIDFGENSIVPFEYRNIHALKGNPDLRLVTVSDGRSVMLYRLKGSLFEPVTPVSGWSFHGIPGNDSIVFTSGGVENHIINIKSGAHAPVRRSLKNALYDRFLEFKGDGGRGLLNLKGEVVVPAAYYRIMPYEGSYIFLERGSKGDTIGILNRHAEIIIPPVFRDVIKGRNRFFVRSFNNGRKLRLPEKAIEEVSEWTATWNKTTQKWYSLNAKQINQLGLVGAFDLSGKLVIPFAYDYLKTGVDTEIIASKNSKVGIISEDGKVLANFSYQSIESAFGSYYVAKLGAKKRVLGRAGKPVFGEAFDDVFFLSAEKVLLLRQGQWFLCDLRKPGVLTKTGLTRESRLQYLYEYPSSNEYGKHKTDKYTYFEYRKNGKYGIIDDNLKVVVSPIHDHTPTFYFGKFFEFNVRPGGSAYTLKGKFMEGLGTVTSADFESSRFPNAIICHKNKKYGVIDLEGNELIPFEYTLISHIDGKRFVVSK